MKSFKEFIIENHDDDEVIGFCNAGGSMGQYDTLKLSSKPSIGFCNAGGSIGQYDKIEENLNPKERKSIVVRNSTNTFTDPDKSNIGLGNEQYKPEHIDIDDYHNKGFVVPNNNKEHTKNIKSIAPIVNKNNDYHDMMDAYTHNSYNLNNTLLQHRDKKTIPPNSIRANLERDNEIHLDEMDNLISSHKLPNNITVYTGTHLDPAQYKGKIMRLPAYTSTSINPHVAKDFGKTFDTINHQTGEKEFVKHLLRIELPTGQQHVFTDHNSHYPGQSEIILPRNTKLQLGREPSHIIHGNFASHFNGKTNPANGTIHYIWNARILRDKK